MRFPHLLPPDAALLEQFLTADEFHYSDLWFDVHVGEGTDPGDQFSIEMRRMSITLSQRRIDCVAQAADSIHIIEVTTQAGMTALGQLMAYPALYQATYTPDLPVRPFLVTRSFKPDIQPLFDFYGIEYRLIPQTLPGSTGVPAP